METLTWQEKLSIRVYRLMSWYGKFFFGKAFLKQDSPDETNEGRRGEKSEFLILNGLMWSNSKDDGTYGRNLNFYSGSSNPDSSIKYYGFPVRCVRDSKTERAVNKFIERFL